MYSLDSGSRRDHKWRLATIRRTSMGAEISRRSFLISSASSAALLAGDEQRNVHSLKTPNRGVQPQAVVDSRGVIHLVYLYGDPAAADIGYVRKGPNDETFSAPIRVNSH